MTGQFGRINQCETRLYAVVGVQIPCANQNSPVIAFVVITTVIGSFQIYDTIAITTKGGPVTATYAIYLFIYKNGFEAYKMGYSCAASMVLFALLAMISAIQMKVMKASESDA